MGKAENSLLRKVYLSRGQLQVSTASPCKHLMPRKSTSDCKGNDCKSATQKRDPKQTHASEGAMKFSTVQITEDTTT